MTTAHEEDLKKDKKDRKLLHGYTMHSGGALGSDHLWDAIGQGYGVTDMRHYYFGDRTPYGNTCLHINDFAEGWRKVQEANLTLKRGNVKKYKNLLSRNWAQVKYSDAVYAIGVTLDFKTVDGGTGWAVQMAINAGKPVYLFDQMKGRWYEWEVTNPEITLVDSHFEPMKVLPVLTKNFAGIGSRQHNNLGMKAIISVYMNTLDHENKL